jgi:hypothetical protein
MMKERDASAEEVIGYQKEFFKLNFSLEHTCFQCL